MRRSTIAGDYSGDKLDKLDTLAVDAMIASIELERLKQQRERLLLKVRQNRNRIRRILAKHGR